jgi:hypothetical protein
MRSLCGGEMKGRSLVVDIWLWAIAFLWRDEEAIALWCGDEGAIAGC